MDAEQAPLLSSAPDSRGAEGRGRLVLALVGLSFLLIAAVALPPGGAASRQVQRAEAENITELTQVLSDKLATAINGGVLSEQADQYTQDAVAYWDPSQGLSGMDTMVPMMREISPPTSPWTLTVGRAYLAGGRLYGVVYVGGPFAIEHNCLLRWRKSGGQWLMDQDIPVWGEQTISHTLPSESTHPAFLVKLFADMTADWGSITWGDYKTKYFHQDAVTYVRAPGQPIGDFLDNEHAFALMSGNAPNSGVAKDRIQLEVLSTIVHSPDSLSVLGRCVLHPDSPPFFQQWTKGANGWKVSEFLVQVGI